MRDLQNMIKSNSVNNSYFNNRKQSKKSMKIEEIILFEQSQMGYVDRSVQNIFTRLSLKERQNEPFNPQRY